MNYETKIYLALIPMFILIFIIGLIIVYQYLKTKYVSRQYDELENQKEKQNLLYKPLIVTV